MMLLKLIYIFVPQLSKLQVVKLIEFRESFCSIQVSKTASYTESLPCEKMKVKIDSNFSPSNGLILDMACDEENARVDMNFEDYFNNERMFSHTVTLTVTITHGDPSTELIKLTENVIQVKPGTVKKLKKTDTNGIIINVDIIYRCHGYDGYNCNFEKMDHPYFYRDPHTRKAVCDAKSEECVDKTCPSTSKKGCVGNKCFVNTFGDKSEYCVCNEGNHGDTCGGHSHDPPLDEETLLFAPTDDVKQPQATTDTCDDDCQTCKLYDQLKVCTSLKESTFRYTCLDDKCDETCGHTFCRLERVESEVSSTIYYKKEFSKKYSASQTITLN